ncbi:hypothetical protein Peur_005122 [Populus x canadensis]
MWVPRIHHAFRVETYPLDASLFNLLKMQIKICPYSAVFHPFPFLHPPSVSHQDSISRGRQPLF